MISANLCHFGSSRLTSDGNIFITVKSYHKINMSYSLLWNAKQTGLSTRISEADVHDIEIRQNLADQTAQTPLKLIYTVTTLFFNNAKTVTDYLWIVVAFFLFNCNIRSRNKYWGFSFVLYLDQKTVNNV